MTKQLHSQDISQKDTRGVQGALLNDGHWGTVPTDKKQQQRQNTMIINRRGTTTTKIVWYSPITENYTAVKMI